MEKIHTINGEAYIILSEIIGIMPKTQRDNAPYILLRCGERIYFEDYHLNQLKQKLIKQ